MAKTPNSAAASRGKVKGKGAVVTKAEKDAQAAVETQAPRADVDLHGAYEAGHLASKVGHPSKPPAGLSDDEKAEWHRGYKAHANPPSTNSVEPREGDQRDGYRTSY